ncbi:MAG: tol-pal system protein YbgF, partial [Casimicrobiaceae bacterium]
MLGFRSALAAAAIAGLCFTLSARAALFDDEEARKRIDAANLRLTQVQKQLDDRIAALETQLKSQGLVELFSQVEQLKGDVAKLRGQIEVLTYEQEQQQKRQRDLYVDLDSRLRKLESGPAPAATGGDVPPPVAAGVPPPIPASAATNEQRAYDIALDQFKAGSYAAAVAGFSAFVKTFPKSSLAPSAQYWIGNAQYAQRDFRGAIATQRQLIAAYPDSLKVPDAMLNIATAQLDLGETAASKRTLEDLVAKFPKSD